MLLTSDGFCPLYHVYMSVMCQLEWIHWRIFLSFYSTGWARRHPRMTQWTCRTSARICTRSSASGVALTAAIVTRRSSTPCVSASRRAATCCCSTYKRLCKHAKPTSSHYHDVIMGTMASQITGLTSVYSTVSGADQRKHQSSALLAFVWGIHRGPVNSPHKWPVTRKMFLFDDVIMSRVWISNYIHRDRLGIITNL